jgi:hypothetical protein
MVITYHQSMALMKNQYDVDFAFSSMRKSSSEALTLV